MWLAVGAFQRRARDEIPPSSNRRWRSADFTCWRLSGAIRYSPMPLIENIVYQGFYLHSRRSSGPCEREGPILRDLRKAPVVDVAS